jgi:hypothetical protein
LLDGFAVNIPGEVPLFVNEARSDEKLRAIRNSDLSWCLGQLASEDEGIACSASIWMPATSTCSTLSALLARAFGDRRQAATRHPSSTRSSISLTGSPTLPALRCTFSTHPAIRWGWPNWRSRCHRSETTGNEAAAGDTLQM